MSQVKITKQTYGEKTFYYAQFYKLGGCTTEARSNGEYSHNPREEHRQVWHSVQLGYVYGDSNQFIVSDMLYTGVGYTNASSVFNTEITFQEMTKYSGMLYEAIAVAQTRYEGKMYRAITNIEKWLRNPQDDVPMFDRDHMIIIRHLDTLKLKMLDICRDKQPAYTSYG